MKEDILEQIVDDYLQTRGYFTRHNVKFRPRKRHQHFSIKEDSVPSDIDVIGVNPHLRGPAKVWVVGCKSWQSGFNVPSRLAALKENKTQSGREAWQFFRELMVPKWSEAFRAAVFRETGARRFTYVTAVTKLSGDRAEWESHRQFLRAMRGNPIRLLSLYEMVLYMLPRITKTPAGSDLGRTLQLLKASGLLDVLQESAAVQSSNGVESMAQKHRGLRFKPRHRHTRTRVFII
jgi:hypothetical protein